MKHFRLVKGWKKEAEEISLGFVFALFIVVSLTTTVTASGIGPYFYGKVKSPPIPCTAGPTNPCNAFGVTSPYWVLKIDGMPQTVAVIPPTNICFSKPSTKMYLLGFGMPGGSVFRAGIYCGVPE